jgi:hypothetical protein
MRGLDPKHAYWPLGEDEVRGFLAGVPSQRAERSFQMGMSGVQDGSVPGTAPPVAIEQGLGRP